MQLDNPPFLWPITWQPIECWFVGNVFADSNASLAFLAFQINSKLKPLKRTLSSKRFLKRSF